MRLRLLRLVLGVLFVYHLGIGLVSVLSPDTTVRFTQWFYGAQLSVDAQFAYTLKALGIYALFTAGVIGVALRDPPSQRPLLFAVAGLLLMRAGARFFWADLLAEGLHVTPSHNGVNIGLLIVQAGLILWLSRPR